MQEADTRPQQEMIDQPEPANTEQETDTAAQQPDYLSMALQSGIAPLEMRFSQINSSYRRLPVAYRSFTYINSVIEGVIPPEKYVFAADGTDRGIRLARWNIIEAMKAVRRFEEAGRHIDFVTARCPARLALEQDLYGWMRALMDEHSFNAPEKLCLEFPRTLLYEDETQIRASILSMKLLKVRTMMSGCGEKDCPVTTLINIPVDYAVLAPWMTSLIDNRDRGGSISSFLAFIRSLSIDVIADGARSDDQISSFSRADCYGYIPSPNYNGSVQHGRLRMTLDEAVSQNEEDI